MNAWRRVWGPIFLARPERRATRRTIRRRGADPGGDQDRADLVAVQPGGVGLVLQPRTTDVRRRQWPSSSSSTAYG